MLMTSCFGGTKPILGRKRITLPEPYAVSPTKPDQDMTNITVPPSTTPYPRSTYDLWRAGSSPSIFHRLKILSRSPRHFRARPTNLRCILDQHTLSPIKVRLLPICPFFQSGRERGLIGSLV